MKYKRVLLKLSGEAIKNSKDEIIDFNYLKDVCEKIKNVRDSEYEFGIVIGGGNIWRGRNDSCIDVESADNIGLIGTTINAMAINAVFKNIGVNSKVINAFAVENILEQNKEYDINELIKENIVVFGGGTGHGGCSTDTAAAKRAIEINADAIIKITNVDGVYDKDPNKFDDAVMYDEVSFKEAIDKELKVLDITAMEMCQKENIPIIVININKLDQLVDVLNGINIGTIIC